MTDAWKSLTTAQKLSAEEAFATLSTLDDLKANSTTASDDKDSNELHVGLSDVYAFATGMEQPTQALREALLRDPRLRSALDHFLNKTAVYRFPKVAAAASGSVEGRDGKNYRISLKVSRAAPQQTYVIIEMQVLDQNLPSALFFHEPDGEYGIHPLPIPESGVIQILADSDSSLVNAIRNVDTEIYLR